MEIVIKERNLSIPRLKLTFIILALEQHLIMNQSLSKYDLTFPKVHFDFQVDI